VSCELAAAGLNGAEVIELLLEAIGIAASKLFVASGLGFCFACGGIC
jgi:hypothetical protein